MTMRHDRGPRRGRILVVDDDELVRRVVIRALTADHEVVEASGGGQALEVLTGAAVEFDLVLLDVEMPDVNGVDVWRELESRAPARLGRIVIMTGGGRSRDA